MILGIWHPAEHYGWTWVPATRRNDLLVVLGSTILWETAIATSVMRIPATLRPVAQPSSLAVAVARRQRNIVWFGPRERVPLAGRSRAAVHVEHSEVVCIVSREELERRCQW